MIEEEPAVLTHFTIKAGVLRVNGREDWQIPLSNTYTMGEVESLLISYASEYPYSAGTEQHIKTLVRDYFTNKASLDKIAKASPKLATPEERERLVAAIAESLMQEHHFVTLRDNMEMRYYENGIYIEGATGRIHSYIVQTLGYQLKDANRKEVIEHIRHRNHVDRTDFDAEPDFINLKNGLLNIRTGELRPHDPAYLSLSQIPRNYDPKASCPRFSKFLVEVLEKDKVREAVKMLGYMLHRGMEYEKSFILLGNGSNGKSTLINVIRAFFGAENCSHESLHSLVGDKFAAAEMYLKYVNLFADLKSAKLPETGPFKMLTSGDPMSAQKKYGKRFNFRNFAKMVFSANIPPELDDNTYAAYRRLVIFAFDRTFPQNDNLLRELTTEAELAGILNLALKGWRWLQEDRGFAIESVERIKQDYQYRANNIKRFLDDECNLDVLRGDWFTETKRLYMAYADFCRKEKLRAIPYETFGTELVQHGIIHKQKSVNKQRGYYYIGVRLKSDMAEGNQTLVGGSSA